MIRSFIFLNVLFVTVIFFTCIAEYNNPLEDDIKASTEGEYQKLLLLLSEVCFLVLEINRILLLIGLDI